MKYCRLLILFLFIASGLYAQTGADPYVTNPQLTPAPLAGLGDEFDVSFDIGNSGTAPISGVNAINSMGFTLSLGKCAPSPIGSGVAAVSGTIFTYFNIVYDEGTKTFVGTQKANVAIPLLTAASISVHVEVTQLSPNMGTNDIGAAVNIQPAPVSNPQPTANDFASIYTHTLTILPITIRQFNAVSNGCSASMDLETAAESNTANFELQLMTEGGTWATINKLPANGAASTYTASFALVENKVNYIRLKINDKDGKSTYTEVKALRCNGKPVITLRPNPVKNILRIDGIPAGAKLSMFDVNGKLLNAFTASGSYTLNTSMYAAGFYVLKVSVDGKIISIHKVIKE